MTRKQRVNEIKDILSHIEVSLTPRERILIDKILELEDLVLELQTSYSELLVKYKSLSSDVY